jgi:golgin subfamily B member 1
MSAGAGDDNEKKGDPHVSGAGGASGPGDFASPARVFPSSSLRLAAEKARSQRVTRLKAMLDQRLETPILAVDALMAELGEGEAAPDMWEQLHASAARDKMEAQLAEAYARSAVGARMRRLSAGAQAHFLMHAADYTQGVMGDAEKAAGYLARVLEVMPTHVEAFNRLEKRFEKLLDSRRLLDLYASVAFAPPKAANVLATQAFNRVLQLTPKDPPLSDDIVKQLVPLAKANPRLIDALEGHCKSTKRPALAQAMFEAAIASEGIPDAVLIPWRQRATDLYMTDTNPSQQAKAMPHVEDLLKRNPNDAIAYKACERLLSNREVSSRAAATLQTARKARTP